MGCAKQAVRPLVSNDRLLIAGKVPPPRVLKTPHRLLLLNCSLSSLWEVEHFKVLIYFYISEVNPSLSLSSLRSWFLFQELMKTEKKRAEKWVLKRKTVQKWPLLFLYGWWSMIECPLQRLNVQENMEMQTQEASSRGENALQQNMCKKYRHLCVFMRGT